MRNIFLACASALLLAGCGASSSVTEPSATMTKLVNLIAFNSTTAPKPIESIVDNTDKVDCPVVDVEEGGGSVQVGSGAGLRHQYAISDTARECLANNKLISIRVGIAGRIVAGPAGGAGTFQIPVRLGVRREADKKMVVSKVVNMNATIAPGQATGTFEYVADPLVVPWLREEANEDYMIVIGLVRR